MFTRKPRLAAALAAAGTVLALAAGPASAAIPIQKWTQPSGAQVYLVESPSIPMVDVRVEFDAGSRREPDTQAGLAAVTAGMTSKGIAAHGSEPALDENQLGEAWADLGADFDAGAGNDRMGFSLRSLTYPDILPRAVALAARQLGEPAFPEAVWQRERERISAGIREADTRPATVAGKAFRKAVYSGHPYGHETTPESLSHIGVADMRRFYGLLEPCRAKVSIVGAVSRAQADQIVTTLLSRLPAAQAGQCAALPAVPEVPPLAAPSEIDVPFAAAQAQVLLGQPGAKRKDPDFFPLLVGNYVLGGGGLVSRLSAEVREKRGLTYGVGSGFSPGMHAGAFGISLSTRPDQAAQALQVVREVLQRFVKDGPTEKELQAAKDYYIGGFPLLLDSNRKLLDNIANIAWYDLPLDYLDTWVDHIRAVTPAQVRTAFERKLDPQRMVTVVVGAQPPAVAAAPAKP